MGQTTLVIADNQPLTAFGLKAWAEKSDFNFLIIEFLEKEALIDYLQQMTDKSVLLVIDIELFELFYKEEAVFFFQEHKHIRKLFIGDNFSEEQLLFAAEEIKANVILKNIDLEELCIAVSFTLKDRNYIQSELLSLLMKGSVIPSKPLADVVQLTPTERDIATLIANGKTTKEVARIRNLSYHTVVTHRKNIFRKTGVCSIHELTVYAIKTGLIDPTEYYI